MLLTLLSKVVQTTSKQIFSFFFLFSSPCLERSIDFEGFRGPSLWVRFCSLRQVCKPIASPLIEAGPQEERTTFNTSAGPMLCYILTFLHNFFKTRPQSTWQCLLSWALWTAGTSISSLTFPRSCQQEWHSTSNTGPAWFGKVSRYRLPAALLIFVVREYELLW